MTTNELLEDLSKLRNTEIIRCQLEKNTLSLQVVFDNDEDIEQNQTSEEEDDEDILNGHLYTLVFTSVTGFEKSGEEADNYTTKKVDAGDHHLSLSLQGHNRIGDDTELELSFSFKEYHLEDNGRIKGPDV